MENITLGQIGAAVAFLVALIGGVAYLLKKLKEFISATLKEELAPLKSEIKETRCLVDKVDLENCKNFLVTFLAGIEKGVYYDPIETQRFWEEYEHYTSKGGNSYIKQSVESLKAKGKI